MEALKYIKTACDLLSRIDGALDRLKSIEAKVLLSEGFKPLPTDESAASLSWDPYMDTLTILLSTIPTVSKQRDSNNHTIPH
ncbi:Sedoheptulokinase [Manis pentadactyla]|nr:Sedoheptulokinase [Manis pentadactyla]